MATILALKKKLEALNTDEVITAAVKDGQEMMADLNASQMFEGIRKDETDITPDYANMTIALKQEKGQPTDRVTLRDTGDFYQGIYARVEGDKIEFSSKDEKTTKLERKYGKKIFGLAPQQRAEVNRQVIKPSLMRRIKEATGL